MTLREIEWELDQLENELRACRRHGVLEFTRAAQRCRDRAARCVDKTERAIWREAARRLDHGAERERGRARC